MEEETYTVNLQTPKHRRHVTYTLRTGTSDGALVSAIIGCDEYALASLPELSGWALDVGSHVGSVAISLAIDHPDLKVIAIEPVPSSAEVIRDAVVRNGLQGRVLVYEAAAGPPDMETTELAYEWDHVEGVDDEHMRQSRFIGNVFRMPHQETVYTAKTVPVISLPALVETYGRFRFAKTDCEGAEWTFFAHGADAVDEIVGEYHDRGIEDMAALLADTHDVTFVGGDAPHIGLFRAVHHHMRPAP